jgi:hypothetical protein
VTGVTYNPVSFSLPQFLLLFDSLLT